MGDGWSDDDWCDEGANDMLRRDGEVQAARMRTQGYTEGVMQCGEDGVKQVAEQVMLEVAPAGRAVGAALGIEDAVRDLFKLSGAPAPAGLPDAAAASSARKAAYKFRKATAGPLFTQIPAISDTNLHRIGAQGEGADAPPGEGSAAHNLLFVPSCVAAVQQSTALLAEVQKGLGAP
eukprot:TRINITY_DN7400_c0_g2_i1.p2 TRINITY_DN7400_c0_g2~~TRINITY_DN7400_c0_g2_i1.p2  ORF type:complete len:177 (+),score=52.53 TRINITY_DN7400_c0_g2_i1:35-565(+)